MKKLLLGLMGIGLLGACSQIVNGFSAFNLAAPKEACVVNAQTSAKELNLSFNYTGTVKGLKLTFSPFSNPPLVNPPVVVDVPNLESLPAGFRINTLTSNEVKIYLDLNTLTPTASAQAITKPSVKELYPMDIKLEATGSNGEKPGALNLYGVDVAKCY